MVLNNPDISTRPISASSPDVALAPPALALNFEWSVTTTLNSDHLPVSLCFAVDVAASRGGRKYVNFRKANWHAFTIASEAFFLILRPPTSCSAGEKEFRRILQKCAARYIPGGSYKTFVPGIDANSASLIEERDERRRRNPWDPEVTRINTAISTSLAASSRQRWMETVRDADRRSNPTRFWRLLKSLSGKKTFTPLINQYPFPINLQ